LLLLAGLCVCPPAARADDPVNVVSDSGFETEGSWEPKADGFAIVPEGRDGGMCLRLAADAPGTAVRKYSQAIRLIPGGLYRASAWMKTTDAKGGEIAPTVSISYFGNGKLLSEDFLFSGQSGTSDWHELTTGCIGTPIGSDAAVLSCYASAGVTGSAWWDDISLTPLPGEPLMRSYLLEPNYRGWMYGDYPSAFRLRVVVNYQETSLDNKDLRLRVLLRSSSGKRVLDVYRGVDQRETSWSVDRPAGLQPGRYTLQVRLTDDRRRTVLARDEHPLLQWGGKTPTARCWMDRHHRLIVDGKPFFPIGMFAGLPTEEDLQRISASPFNCLMPYFLWGQGSSGLIEDQRKYLALSERLGIKTIYSTKDLHSDWVISHLERLHGVEGKKAVLTHLVEAFREQQ